MGFTAPVSTVRRACRNRWTAADSRAGSCRARVVPGGCQPSAIAIVAKELENRLIDEDAPEDDVADANAYFAELRNNYPIRREFSSLLVEFSGPESALLEKLEQLGFHLQPGA